MRAHDFDALKRQFEAGQAAFEAGKLAESTLLNSYFAFGAVDPSLEPHLDAWVEAQPDSFVPKIARGIYHFRLGWVSRSDDPPHLMPPEQFAQVEEHFDSAASDLTAATSLHPKLSVAWGIRVAMAMGSGKPTLDIYRAGIQQVPTSLYLRRVFLQSIDLFWGPDLWAPRWLKFDVLRQLFAVIHSAVLLYKFPQTLEKDAVGNVILNRVINSPLYGKAQDAFAEADFQRSQRILVLALRDNRQVSEHYLAGEDSMAREAYSRAVTQFNAASQMDEFWQETILNRAQALRDYAYHERDFSSLAAAFRDVRSLLEVDTHNPALLMTAARQLWDVVTMFPDQAAGVPTAWGLPECRQGRVSPKDLKFTQVGTPGTGAAEVFCAIAELLDRALLLGNSDFYVREMRGRFYFYSLKKPELAVKEFEQAVRLYSGDPTTWASYAKTLREVGDCQGAEAAHSRYTQLCTQRRDCASGEVTANRLQFASVTLSGACSQ